MSNVVPFRKQEGGESRSVEQLILPPVSSHAYVELAVTTNFSFLRGASHSRELVRQAVALGLSGIGIADRNSVAGVVRAYAEALQLNAKIREVLTNGYYPDRCGQLQLILQPQWIEGFLGGGTTHGLWNPYDAHIPLVW